MNIRSNSDNADKIDNSTVEEVALPQFDMKRVITIVAEPPNTPDALLLMDELSETLESITGDSGRSSFNTNDICAPHALFAIARNQDGGAIGYGAIRPINENIAEVKRMYAKTKAMDIGAALLSYLEKQDINRRAFYPYRTIGGCLIGSKQC